MDKDTRKRYTRRGALGLMGVGAVGVGLETVGYTQLTAGRGVNLALSGDDTGILQSTVASTSDGNVTSGDPLSSVTDTSVDDDLTITFENQSTTTLNANNNDLTVTISETGATNAVTVNSTGFDSDNNISSGGQETYNINADLTTGDTADITLEANNGNVGIDIDIEATFGGSVLSVPRNNIDINDTESVS